MKTIVAKIGDWVKRHRRDIWVGTCIILATWSAYNVGRIRGLQEAQKGAIGGALTQMGTQTPEPQKITVRQGSKPPLRTDMRVVVSKSSSSKKYHYTWCAGASKIKEENKLWFDTAEQAEATGYTLAGNCKR